MSPSRSLKKCTTLPHDVLLKMKSLLALFIRPQWKVSSFISYLCCTKCIRTYLELSRCPTKVSTDTITYFYCSDARYNERAFAFACDRVHILV